MQFGKSIRIYLQDGTVSGIKFGEVVNHTIQSISCPRLKISEMQTYPETQRPGVYFLFGTDEETGEPKAYIGEAENVLIRLQQHVANKDFWNEAILFLSKDENLTKSHVKYLESRIIQIALFINRYKIENYNQSQLSSLPPADRDAMEEFLSYIKLLIGVLGHKLLEEVIAVEKKKIESAFPIDPGAGSANSGEPLQLYLSMSGLKASAIQTNEGIVVLKDSEAAKESTANLSVGYQKQRLKLIETEKLKLVDDKYIFQENVLFNTASPAAAMVLGYNTNGRLNWRDINGKTLKDIEAEKILS